MKIFSVFGQKFVACSTLEEYESDIRSILDEFTDVLFRKEQEILHRGVQRHIEDRKRISAVLSQLGYPANEDMKLNEIADMLESSIASI